MSAVMEEDPEAALLLGDRVKEAERPEEAEWPEWADSLRSAWNTLRGDRFYGAMGGCGTIYYAAFSAYARDHGIEGTELDRFFRFFSAMDGEYVEFCAERDEARRKQEESKAKK